MSQLADDLIVIGDGRLISAGPLKEFVRQHAQSHVVVRSPHATQLMVELSKAGLRVRQDAPDSLFVDVDDTQLVADVAARAQFPIKELFVQQSGLEAAFMAATANAVRHRGESS
jgi:ABC-2 type transport system ATP-binding protein